MLRKETDIIHLAMGGGSKSFYTCWGGVQKVLVDCEGGVKKVWRQKFSIAQPPPHQSINEHSLTQFLVKAGPVDTFLRTLVFFFKWNFFINVDIFQASLSSFTPLRLLTREKSCFQVNWLIYKTYIIRIFAKFDPFGKFCRSE